MKPKQYFPAVHAFRGLAAVWVVLFHIDTLGISAYLNTQLFDGLYRLIFDYGRGGVAVFFVLSGFVISHSLHGKTIGFGFFGRFLIRRSVRLDPPYWLSIVMTIVFYTIISTYGSSQYDFPSAASIIAHMFYLQELLQFPEIQLIYWTLTYEIQFYLVLCLLYLMYQKCLGWGMSKRLSLMIVVGPAAVIALIGAVLEPDWVMRGLFLNYWFAFFVGCLAYYGGVRRVAVWPLLLILVLAMLMTADQMEEVFKSPAAITAVILFVSSRTDILDRFSDNQFFKVIGNLSYSLYLTHYIILLACLRLVDIARRNFGSSFDLIYTSLALGICVAFAYIFWRLVERPSQNFSKKIAMEKPQRAKEEAAVST